jgi:hypothetical protein
VYNNFTNSREDRGKTTTIVEAHSNSLYAPEPSEGVKERHLGVSGRDVTPSILNTGSLRGVSGCTSNLFSQRAADDLDGSKPAGSDSEPKLRGCQLEATTWEATNVGTIANSPGLKMNGGINNAALEAMK